MHEYALVRAHVDALNERLRAEGSPRVLSVRFERGNTIMEEAVRQAWEVTTAGTALEGAALEIESVVIPAICDCGHERQLEEVDHGAHLWLCPICDRLHPVDEEADLRLVHAVVA